MATYAQLNDVSKRLGRPITDANEIAQVEAWLTDVEAIIAGRFTRSGLILADQVALDNPSVATLIRVEAATVIRKMSNPTGLTSVTRSVDDASVTERRDGATASDLGLLNEEWEQLLPDSTSGAFSTRPGFLTDAEAAAL